MPNMCLILGTLMGVLWFQTVCVYTTGGSQFGVILDAGSSGTKLKVYKWQKPKLITEIPSMDLLHSHKFRPGIGHFAKRIESLPGYLRDIVIKAEEIVPVSLRAATPIYLMATAGARILDGNIALGLFNRIRNVLSNTTVNPFRFSGKNVRILSGEEEGVFAWVALNALSGFFNSTRPATESLGLLEMGGGSTQIAFIPTEPLYAGEFQVYIGGRRYDLYVHSYLFFGVNYIKQRVHNYLVDLNQGVNKTLHNPCRVKGDQTTAALKNGTKVTFIGDSDPSACADILRHFLSKATGDRCHPKPCAIGSVYQPNVGNTSFYATQGFVYTPQTMRSLTHNKHLNITRLQEEANIYCSQSFTDVKTLYGVEDKFASDECLMGLYIPLLLMDAYQIDPDTTTVTVSNKIHNHRIDWTQGAMLYELNMMFQSKRLMPQTTIPCQRRVNITETADQPLNVSYIQVEHTTPANAVSQEITSSASRYCCIPLQTLLLYMAVLLVGVVL